MVLSIHLIRWNSCEPEQAVYFSVHDNFDIAEELRSILYPVMIIGGV
jgi:hypothetical protein